MRTFHAGIVLLLLFSEAFQSNHCKDVSSLEDFSPVKLDSLESLSNFVLSHKRALIHFYDRTDMYSRLMDFEFHRAAQVVHANPKYTTKLGVFDMVDNKHRNISEAVLASFAKEFSIKANDYPHLRYFVEHDLHNARRYDGSRHENGIIKWVQLQEEPPALSITNVDMWKQFTKAHDYTLIAYIPPHKKTDRYEQVLSTFREIAQSHRKWNETSIGFGVVYHDGRVIPMTYPLEYLYKRSNDPSSWISLENCKEEEEEEELSQILKDDPYVRSGASLRLRIIWKPRIILYRKFTNPYHIKHNKELEEIEFVQQQVFTNEPKTRMKVNKRGQIDENLFDDLAKFIAEETLPLVEEITGMNYNRYMRYHNSETLQHDTANYKTMVWIALENIGNSRDLAFVQGVVSFYYDLAQRSKYNRLLFAMIDFARFPEHVRMLNIPFVPGLMIVHGPNKFLYPPHQSIISHAHVNDFFFRFHHDMLPVFRTVPDKTHEDKTTFGNEMIKPVRASSQVPLPQYFSNSNVTLEFRYGVYLLDGHNVDKGLIAWNAHSHILMCYYLAHDRSSRQFLLELQKIARNFSEELESNQNSSVVIMQIDCENSDCPEMIETYPHIRFYERNSIQSYIGGIGIPLQENSDDIRFYKGSAGFIYSGDLNATDVINSLRSDLLVHHSGK